MQIVFYTALSINIFSHFAKSSEYLLVLKYDYIIRDSISILDVIIRVFI